MCVPFNDLTTDVTTFLMSARFRSCVHDCNFTHECHTFATPQCNASRHDEGDLKWEQKGDLAKWVVLRERMNNMVTKPEVFAAMLKMILYNRGIVWPDELDNDDVWSKKVDAYSGEYNLEYRYRCWLEWTAANDRRTRRNRHSMRGGLRPLSCSLERSRVRPRR